MINFFFLNQQSCQKIQKFKKSEKSYLRRKKIKEKSFAEKQDVILLVFQYQEVGVRPELSSPPVSESRGYPEPDGGGRTNGNPCI